MKKITHRKITTKLAMVLIVLAPVLTYVLFELYTHNLFLTMYPRTHFLNVVLYELLFLILWAICKKAHIALMIETGFFMIAGLANYYVLSFRGTPIMPWDIYSATTALSVADNYDYSLRTANIMIVVCFVLLLATEALLCRSVVFTKIKTRIICGMIAAVSLVGYTNLVQSDSAVITFRLYDKLFTPTVMSVRDGTAVAFLMQMEYLRVDKPDGYSAEGIEEQIKSAEDGNTVLQEALAAPENVKRPNIIVVMNEAFSDLAILGEFETNEDYMPYLHSLQEGAENTITGNLHVSIIGGNTPNTEYEFLTGNTMAFYPQGSVPFQQYLKQESPSVVSYLKDLGYNTVALHPYHASGWERDRVYPLLGFDEFISKEEMHNRDVIRNYVSDRACYEEIIEIYEEKEENTPLFLFNVTMQNHSSYNESYENFEPYIELPGIHSKTLPLYLSLLAESDKALEELIAYFAQVEEDTMIVFFGDHQPIASVSNPILLNAGINPGAVTQEQNLLRYQVPYLIWSNFDIEEKTENNTSANYLATEMLQQCGLPLPPYGQFLADLQKEYPVITAFEVRDVAGNYRLPENCEKELNEYRKRAYYMLFDYGNK